MNVLETLVRSSEDRTNVLHEQIEQLDSSVTQSNSYTKKRIDQLESRVSYIENNYLTKEDANIVIQEMQSKFESLNPLNVVDINNLISDYLYENNYKPLDKNVIFDLITVYTTTHGISLEQIKEEDYNQLRDQISSYALREMHKIMFEDSVGKPDFALGAVGAKVIDYTGKWAINNLLDVLLPFGEKPNPPTIALEGHKQVGDCWAFHGSNAFLTIRLSSKIIPESVSVEHIAISIAHVPKAISAPKRFRVFVCIFFFLFLFGN